MNALANVPVVRCLLTAAIIAALSSCGVESPTALTVAMTATSAEPEPSVDVLEDIVVERAAAAVRPGDGAVSLVVQGAPGARHVDLTPMRGGDVEANYAKIDAKIAKLLPRLRHQLETAAATSDGLDVLGVLDRAVQATPPGGHIIMMTSGLSTTDPIDLTRAGEWLVDPQKFVDQLDPEDIPDATGRSISWVGLGYAAPGSKQVSAGPAGRRALVDLWTGVCEAANAAACDVVVAPPAMSDPVSHNDVPVVKLDQVITRCVGSSTIDADVVFGEDSAVLAPGADRVLRPVAEGLRSCPDGRRVDAVGHAAEVPGGGNGLALSSARATEVLTRLRELGSPVRVLGEASGVGSVRDQIVDNTPDGVYDEELARKNRVVELVVRD